MNPRDFSYEEMSKGAKVFEDSEEPTDRVPFENDFERNRSGSNGLDQSGMKG